MEFLICDRNQVLSRRPRTRFLKKFIFNSYKGEKAKYRHFLVYFAWCNLQRRVLQKGKYKKRLRFSWAEKFFQSLYVVLVHYDTGRQYSRHIKIQSTATGSYRNTHPRLGLLGKILGQRPRILPSMPNTRVVYLQYWICDLESDDVVRFDFVFLQRESMFSL